MPFNFNSYAEEVAGMEDWELAIEKQKYTRSASGSVVGGFGSLLLGPFAPVGWLFSASAASNAAIKLGIINDEMCSRDEYTPTRCRDIFGGGLISAATLGLGHGVTHVANNLITHATHHALTQGQHTLTHQVGHSVEKGAERAVDRALEEHATSKALLAVSTINRVCDVCYTSVGSEYAHCDQCDDFDYCHLCYFKYRHHHTRGHTFNLTVNQIDGVTARLALLRGARYV